MSHKILVVDDEPAIILLMKARLEAMHYQVLTASNGVEAIQIFQKEKPDLIITDVMMPGMTGYEFFEALRKLGGEGSSVPVIVTSARHSMSQFFDKWAINCFMPKPFNPVDLAREVEKILDSKEKLVSADKSRPTPSLRDARKILMVGVSEYEMRKMKEYLESQSCAVIQGLDEKDAFSTALSIRPDYIFMEFWEDAGRFDALRLFGDLLGNAGTKAIPYTVFCRAALNIEASKSFSQKHLLTFHDVAELLRKLESLVQNPEFRRRSY